MATVLTERGLLEARARKLIEMERTWGYVEAGECSTKQD